MDGRKNDRIRISKLNLPVEKARQNFDEKQDLLEGSQRPQLPSNICIVDVDEFLEFTPEEQEKCIKLLIEEKENESEYGTTEIILSQREIPIGFFLEVFKNKEEWKEARKNINRGYGRYPILYVDDAGNKYLHGRLGEKKLIKNHWREGWATQSIDKNAIGDPSNTKLDQLIQNELTKNNKIVYVPYDLAIRFEKFHTPFKIQNCCDVKNIMENQGLSVAPFAIKTESRNPINYHTKEARKIVKVISKHYTSEHDHFPIQKVSFYSSNTLGEYKLEQYNGVIYKLYESEKEPIPKYNKKVTKEKNLKNSSTIRKQTINKNRIEILTDNAKIPKARNILNEIPGFEGFLIKKNPAQLTDKFANKELEDDNDDIRSYKNKRKEILQEIERSAPQHFSLFNDTSVSPVNDNEEIYKLISFMEYNIEFFLETIKADNLEFIAWGSKIPSALQLNKDLLQALNMETPVDKTKNVEEANKKTTKEHFTDYQEAFLGRVSIHRESGEKIKGLFHGNNELMFKVLQQNPELRLKLAKQMNHYKKSPIKLWYAQKYPRNNYIKMLTLALSKNEKKNLGLSKNLKLNKEVTTPLRSIIHNIINIKALSDDEKTTSIEQVFVDTYWQLREQRFLGISKTADALEKIINSKYGLDLPGKYGALFRVPHDVTGKIKPRIREQNDIAVVTVSKTKADGAKDETRYSVHVESSAKVKHGYDIKQIEEEIINKVKKETKLKEGEQLKIDTCIPVYDIRANQNEYFVEAALKLIQSRIIPNATKDKDKFTNSYINKCLLTLDKVDQPNKNVANVSLFDFDILEQNDPIQNNENNQSPANEKIVIKNSPENKFKLQLILKDFIDQGLLGRQNTPMLNPIDLAKTRDNLDLAKNIEKLNKAQTIAEKLELKSTIEQSFNYIIQQLEIVLAHTKTNNPALNIDDGIEKKIDKIKIEWKEFIAKKDTENNIEPITEKEIRTHLDNLHKDISDSIGTAKTHAKERNSKTLLCIFPFYDQSNLADALQKFKDEVIAPLIEHKDNKLTASKK